MNEPAQTFDDDDFSPMSTKDWIDLIGDDIDEAIDDLENERDLAQLVAFLRAKADEIAAIELEDSDPEEECERDEEEALE
jgi:hypothetical protein